MSLSFYSISKRTVSCRCNEATVATRSAAAITAITVDNRSGSVQ